MLPSEASIERNRSLARDELNKLLLARSLSLFLFALSSHSCTALRSPYRRRKKENTVELQETYPLDNFPLFLTLSHTQHSPVLVFCSFPFLRVVVFFFHERG